MDRLTFDATAAMDGNTLSGVAYAFGQRTFRNGQWHTFAEGAFDDALARGEVRAFWNHDTTLLLGRQANGTVSVSVEPDGVHYAIDLPATSYAADLKALVDRGDLREMSFGIVPGKTRLSRADDGKQLVTHTSVASFFDISPVSLPAFGETTTQLHSDSEGEPLRSQTIKARHRARMRTDK